MHRASSGKVGVSFGAAQRPCSLRSKILTGVQTNHFKSLKSNARKQDCHAIRVSAYSSTFSAPKVLSTATSVPPPEVLKAYTKLQNGSDVRGVALDINPDEPVTLTPGMMFFIGSAFADWMSQKLNKPVNTLKASVGHDSRLSSPTLSAAMLAGLSSRGVSVSRFDLCTTPAMFMSCILPEYKYDGGIMVTASHLPVNRNGAKFFIADGGLAKKDITWLLNRAAELATEAGVKPLDIETDTAHVIYSSLQTDAKLFNQINFLEAYSAHLRNIIIQGINHPEHPDRPLTGMKIVVNAGNGAGGFIATQVLGPLGADISDSIHLNPDGHFPNHTPNPEDKKAVEATRAQVLATNADMGLMFDTDVDRSGVVDKHGFGINRNRYIALMAAIALRENPGETVVTDSCTSNGVAAFIQNLGGTHLRFKKGYKNIIDKGIELNNSGTPCPLMMETSGHGAMRENYFLDDGAYGALKIVIEAVRRRLANQGDISELLEDLREPKEAMEIRVKLIAEDIKAEGDKVTAAFKDWVLAGAGGAKHWIMEEENYEGWRLKVLEGDGNEGWLLLRPSLHDPDIVLNVESELEGGMRVILAHLLTFFKLHPEFQVSTALVEKYVQESS